MFRKEDYCIKALKHSNGTCISSIYYSDSRHRYLIELCDDLGHELDMKALDTWSGEVFNMDPTPSDGYWDPDIEEEVPARFLSEKGILLRMAGGLIPDSLSRSCLGRLYNKLNLYDVKPVISYSILCYFVHYAIENGKTKYLELSQAVRQESRSLEELTQLAKPYRMKNFNTIFNYYKSLKYDPNTLEDSVTYSTRMAEMLDYYRQPKSIRDPEDKAEEAERKVMEMAREAAMVGK